jgi:uncharacterized repeat protein (TIGR03803 family)
LCGSRDEELRYDTLLQATDGNIYGMTETGGANGGGTLFKMTPSGTLTTLYEFCSESGCTDGEDPSTKLVQAANGDFYGEAYSGGAHGGGTIFRITPTGTLTTLYSFCSDYVVNVGCVDGQGPNDLIQATNGSLYGATYSGGANGDGTLFKIAPNGTLTTLYSFCSQGGCPDGSNPTTGMVQATNGNLYGTTYWGGNSNNGTFFEITPSGTHTTLYSFCSQSECTDGAHPNSGVIQATDGYFYGITSDGGNESRFNSHGTVFKISSTGTLTTVYKFCSKSGCSDGEDPSPP